MASGEKRSGVDRGEGVTGVARHGGQASKGGGGGGYVSVAMIGLAEGRFWICGNDWSYGRFFGSVANTGVSGRRGRSVRRQRTGVQVILEVGSGQATTPRRGDESCAQTHERKGVKTVSVVHVRRSESLGSRRKQNG